MILFLYSLKTTMSIPKKNQLENEFNDEDELTGELPLADDLDDDGAPVLDEEDLEENNLGEDEVEDIEWEDAPAGDPDDQAEEDDDEI